jgi:hypothetical protein
MHGKEQEMRGEGEGKSGKCQRRFLEQTQNKAPSKNFAFAPNESRELLERRREWRRRTEKQESREREKKNLWRNEKFSEQNTH